jgi:hypothetical protein
MAWADSLNASRANNANLAADSMTMADAYGVIRGHLARPGTDSLGSYSDSLGAQFAYLVNPAADSLGSYSDTLEATLTGESAITFTSTDSLNVWDDTATGFLTYAASPSADSMTPGDSLRVNRDLLVALVDALGGYSDTLNVTTAAELLASFTDGLNAWGDSLIGIRGHCVAVSDSAALLADSLVVQLAHLVSVSDSSAFLADSLAAFLTHAVRISDGLGGYSDTFNAVAVGPNDIIVALSDSLNAWADTLGIKGWGITATRTCLAASITGSDGRTMALLGADGRALKVRGE